MREGDEGRRMAVRALVAQLEHMGYPPEFGAVIARDLGSEKLIRRMLAYLTEAKPRSAEEIADEMLAIRSDRDRWVSKKAAENYNQKYNELLWYGLGTEEDEE